MGPQIGGYITPGQRLLSDPDVRANTGNGDTWSEPATRSLIVGCWPITKRQLKSLGSGRNLTPAL